MKIQIYTTPKGELRYRLKASNGKNMESDESYKRLSGLMNNIFSKWCFYNRVPHYKHWGKITDGRKYQRLWELFKRNNIIDLRKKK